MQISDHLHGAVVYLDAGCTESFQFLGAFSSLLEHGARAVCCLENMSPLDTVRSVFLSLASYIIMIYMSAGSASVMKASELHSASSALLKDEFSGMTAILSLI